MTSQLETRAASIWAFLFQYGVEELRRAYDAARESPDRDRARLDRQWEELEAEVAAGRASFVEEDSEGRVVYDRGEHAGEMTAEIEGVLRIIREAFAISLHHFWERELTVKLGRSRYDEAEAFRYLRRLGITPNETGLTGLRLAANVAKHSEGRSAEQLYELRPDLFDAERATGRDDALGYEDLRITDEIIDEFFDTVRQSGPQRRRQASL
jgi:hypothetical protein